MRQAASKKVEHGLTARILRVRARLYIAGLRKAGLDQNENIG